MIDQGCIMKEGFCLAVEGDVQGDSAKLKIKLGAVAATFSP